MATRLEDVAADVGLKRAALFYHFRDKQSLYDAMIADAFGALATRLDEAFASEASVVERLERGVEVWVDTITGRPTLARLILRHAAEADEHPGAGLFSGADQLLSTAAALLEEGRASGELEPVHSDLFHAASAVLGGTVFYVAAMVPLLPAAGFDPLAPDEVAAHRRASVELVRLLLGIRPPRPSAPRDAKKPKRRRTR